MVLQKIKPNYLYGFRTKKTLSDEKIWYPANKYAGKVLIYAGIPMAVISAISYILSIIPATASIFNETLVIIIILTVLVVPLTVSIIASLVYLKKL